MWKRCRDETLYIYLRFWIIPTPTLFAYFMACNPYIFLHFHNVFYFFIFLISSLLQPHPSHTSKFLYGALCRTVSKQFSLKCFLRLLLFVQLVVLCLIMVWVCAFLLVDHTIWPLLACEESRAASCCVLSWHVSPGILPNADPQNPASWSQDCTWNKLPVTIAT